MISTTLTDLALHEDPRDTVVLEVGRLSLTMRWNPDGWVLDSAFSVPPHPVNPMDLTSCINYHIGTVIPHETFGRLAVKQRAMYLLS